MNNDWSVEDQETAQKLNNVHTDVLRDVWDVSHILTALERETTHNTLHLTSGEVITNVRHMIKSHIAIVKAQNGNKAYLPYLNRLKKIIEEL